MDARTSRAVRLFEERYGGIRRGGAAALEELLGAFALIPYENLSKIVAWNRGRGDEAGSRASALRDPLTVMSDHLELGTGGTCFSLTELLRQLLEAAGLQARPLMAHMRHGPDIHCALQVALGRELLLVDPGYLVETPLSLEPSGPRRAGELLLVPAGSLPGVPEGTPPGAYDLHTVAPDGQPRWRYRLAEQPASREEFLRHWERSFTLPAMRSLLCTQRSGDELVYLHNHKLRRQRSGLARTQNVRAELAGSVQELFGIHPEVTRRAVELLRAEREDWRRRSAGSPASPREAR